MAVGKGQHLVVAATAGAHVGHLLDEHGVVLAGQARVAAVGAAQGLGTVATLADLEADLAAQRVALGAQGLQLRLAWRSLVFRLARVGGFRALGSGQRAGQQAGLASP
jgi:hypothetical protein